MAKDTKEIKIEYRTLLTQQEYNRIHKALKDYKGDVQSNYYFDTKRFTLKSSEGVLRVKRTDKGLTLILERKKGYQFIRLDEPITEEILEEIQKTGVLPQGAISKEVSDIIKDQLVHNFLTLSTYRISAPYKKGKIALDQVSYCDTVDYELEYQANNKDQGKIDFINIIKEYNINYKKSQVKLKRAYDALKKII